MQAGLSPRDCSTKAKCCIDLEDLETKVSGVFGWFGGLWVGFFSF